MEKLNKQLLQKIQTDGTFSLRNNLSTALK